MFFLQTKLYQIKSSRTQFKCFTWPPEGCFSGSAPPDQVLYNLILVSYLTTRGLFLKLSSTKSRPTISGGSVDNWLLCKLSDWSLRRCRNERGRLCSLLSHKTREVSWERYPTSSGIDVKLLPPKYKISSLKHKFHAHITTCCGNLFCTLKSMKNF